MSTPVITKLLQEQYAILKNLLQPLVEGQQRAAHVDYILVEEDLDREKADEKDHGVVNDALSQSRYKEEAVAAVCQSINESHRIRRDVRIARANHKRLMAASVRTAYNKQTQIEYLLNGLAQKKDI
jgi:hypothetical protein